MSFEESFDDDTGQESSVIQQLRSELKEREKREKQAARELADLQAFKATVEKERTTKQVEALFSERGLNPSLAHLAVKDRPDAEWDPDGVSEWAATYGLAEPPPPKEEAPEPEPAQPVSSFVPTPTVSSPGNRAITLEDYRADMGSGDQNRQMAAMEARRAGRVEGLPGV